jgi:hypothetical protein
MRKIIVGAQVSIDGVMKAPSAPTEDPTKGLKPTLDAALGPGRISGQRYGPKQAAMVDR